MINVHAAKTQLSRLLERVAQGEEVVIAKAGKPVARLVPVEPPAAPRRPGRRAAWAGSARISTRRCPTSSWPRSADALRGHGLPDHHRDPFDRLPVAQAEVEAVPLLSRDPLLTAYGIGLRG